MNYDIIIIWWGASWLFCAINAPKNSKKLIIEKQNKLWTKLLLSGWWRCNFSNINIHPDRYFWLNKKILPSLFHKFNNLDMQSFLEENNIQTQREDNWRIILKSWKSQELLDFLSKKAVENNTEIILNQDITNISKNWDHFILTIHNWEKPNEYHCKKLVIATGGISFPQTWTTGYGITVAKQFWLEIIKPYPALCGIETQTDLSQLSWSSIISRLKILDQHRNNKIVYQQSGNILFTHIWLSGPVIFNATGAIWEYLAKQTKANTNHTHYIQENISIKLSINEENITKRLNKSKLLSENNEILLKIKKITDINKAKVSWGWISMAEIKPNLESKKVSNLYFIWETLDITGQTWWFNLQRARSSGFVCGTNL